jgi:hypothetical protein
MPVAYPQRKAYGGLPCGFFGDHKHSPAARWAVQDAEHDTD